MPISTMDWKEVISSINNSRNLLEALWNLDSDKVAAGVDKAHEEISILQYNDENSLSCTIFTGILFCKRILYDDTGTANRKRFCGYLPDTTKDSYG